MRDLNYINPIISNKGDLSLLLLSVSLIFNGFSLWMIGAAAPEENFSISVLFEIFLVLLILSMLLSPFSWLKKWNYRLKSFPMSLFFCCNFLMLIYLTPLLCIAVFGRFGVSYKLFFLVVFLLIPPFWAWRFVKFYKQIYQTKALFDCLYSEEQDAVYYLDKGNNWLMRKKFKFDKHPPVSWYLIFIGLACAALFLIEPIKVFFGVPFINFFILLIGFPVTLMIIGQLTQDFLTCWYYPMLISKSTGKNVYIDMGTSPKHLGVPN